MSERFDFVVIGAGIAGASAAYELSKSHRVVVLEAEPQPGYHTTGRSAAFFTEAYGNAVMRALTRGSRAFVEDPPAGFSEHPVLSPCGALFVARADQQDTLDELYQAVRPLAPWVALEDAAFALEKVPALRDDYVHACLWDRQSREIDVHALLHGYLRGARRRGSTLVTDARVLGLHHAAGGWTVEIANGRFRGTVVVNAAGSWADELGALAGAPPIGLVPKRRTVCVFQPEPFDPSGWPLVIDVDEHFYFKPDGGRLLLSPADETPMPPCDVYPEDADIALAVQRLETATHISVTRKIDRQWAGLRSFVADKTLVVGFEPELEGFFWLAGQGGYGIQTSPATARCVASLAAGSDIPDDLRALGVTRESLSPARLRPG